MKTITLTNGLKCFIDDEDFEGFSQYNWVYKPSRNTGYARRWLPRNGGKARQESMHQMIMGYFGQVDHIDGNGLNNQKSNLRICTTSQNAANQRKQSRKTTSKFKGVCWDKARMKWYAHIKVNQKLKNLGRYDSEEEAARAYDKAALDAFGRFANLNFKDE